MSNIENIENKELLNAKVEADAAATDNGAPQNKPFNKNKKRFSKGPKKSGPRNAHPGFEEKVVEIKRISKTTKGGRHMRFSALVVVGDKKGSVGFGMGKSVEIPVAIQKAIKNAHNNLVKVIINEKGTVYHDITSKSGACKVLIKPAPEGKGLIAGGAIRTVIELAGFKDIYSKNLGKNTKMNMIEATIKGLKSQKTPSQIAALRSMDIKNL